MNVLVLGCGAIGSAVARAADRMEGVTGLLVFDAVAGAAPRLASTLARGRAVATLDEGLAACDLVVECASQEAVVAHGERVLLAGKDLVLLSVGALGDDALRARLEAAARRTGRRVHVPSGAVAGVDGLRAAAEAGVDEVVLTTSKPPAGLGVDAQSATTLFEGPAREAVKRYPKNVNVAATLALAGVGFDRTRVRIVADPALARNTHRIEVRGAFGEMTLTVANEPFPENPKTSWLAALSAIALLRRLVSPIVVGS